MVVVIIVVFVVVGILVAVVILQKKRLDESPKGSGGQFGFFGVDMKTIKGAEVLANAARPSDAYSVPKKKKKKKKINKPTVPVRKTADNGGLVNTYEEPVVQTPGWEAGDGMYDVPQERPAPAAKKRTASVVSRIDNTEALYDLGNADEEFGGVGDSGDVDVGTFDDLGDVAGYLDMNNDAEPEFAPAAEEEERFGF